MFTLFKGALRLSIDGKDCMSDLYEMLQVMQCTASSRKLLLQLESDWPVKSRAGTVAFEAGLQQFLSELQA